jgi:hypothetical protein
MCSVGSTSVNEGRREIALCVREIEPPFLSKNSNLCEGDDFNQRLETLRPVAKQPWNFGYSTKSL